MFYVKTIIKVSGQNEDEINEAIKIYNEHDKNDMGTIYISFGNNLVMASMVVHMLQNGFKTMLDIDSDELYFVKRRK